MMVNIDHAVARGRIMGLIQTCTACSLHESVNAPVPFRGPSPNALMIIGEAPGRSEDIAGRPFVGRSGKLVDRLLIEAGLPNLTGWFVANVCCCRSVGSPDPAYRKRCEPNLRAQISLCDPKWVLLLGATALNAALPTAKISAIHGRPAAIPAGPFMGRWVFPTFHPAAALRDPKRIDDMRGDLTTLCRLISGTIPPDLLAVRFGRGGKLLI